MSFFVYALLSPPPRRLGTRGIWKEPLTTVTVGTVSAIAGQISRSPKPTERSLRAYNRVIESLARACPAVLPARFGTTFHDAEELRLVLDSRQASLRSLLRHVRNRAQMTIRMVTEPDPPSPRRGFGAASTARPTGTAYLRQRAAQMPRFPEFDPVRAAVTRWVRDERIERQHHVVTVYHLIPSRSVGAYRASLERATGAAGLRMRVSGPWPPYAFTSA